MKKKIAILGSTGSIGKTLLSIIKPDDFVIIFLSTNKNFKKLFIQAKLFKVKNLIITDENAYLKALKHNKKNKFKIFNNFNNLNKIITKKLDYVMSAISGLGGLIPTYKIISFTKKIAIANKESIICAWPLIKKKLDKNKTKFIPVDSEHFSIWSEIKNINPKKIKKIYLTASGGPLLNYNKKNIDNANMSLILKHPTWNMGKKISVDSATMMNKFFEVMEAKNIFNLSYDQLDILIHPKSYIHSIIIYNNGISKIVLHDTTMKIPIFNTIYSDNEIYKQDLKLDLKKLNMLDLQSVDITKFEVLKYLKNIPSKHSLFETVIVSINDTIVENYLKKVIKFKQISKLFLKFANNRKYKIYKKVHSFNIYDIISLNKNIKNDLNKFLN